MEVAMNRLIYMGKYIDRDKEYKIYYNKVLDKFYKLPYDYFFKEEKSGLEILEDLMPEDYEDKDLIKYAINDPEELKGLKAYLDINKKYEEKVEKRDKKLKAELNIILAEQEKRRNRNLNILKAITAGVFVVLVLTSSYAIYDAYGKKIDDKFDDYIGHLATNEETRNEYLSSIIDAITLNETLNDDIKEAWINDFKNLLERDIYIPKKNIKEIIKQASETDYSNLDSNDYIHELSNLIFHDNSSICYGLTLQLDEVANDKEMSESSQVFGYLTIALNDDIFNQIFFFGSDKFNKILADYYGASTTQLEACINLYDNYLNAQNNDDKNNYKNELKNKISQIFLRYYENSEELSEFDQLVFASSIFARENRVVSIQNNLFSDIITVSVDDENYGLYNLYFDAFSKENISRSIYQQQLENLIKNKGSKIDYKDSDDRFLTYLFYLSYRDQSAYRTRKELFEPISIEEFASHLMETVFSDNFYKDDNYTNVNPEFLYSYLTNGHINLDDCIPRYRGINDDSRSVALFIEYEKALKAEVSAGNLELEKYEEQLDEILKHFTYSNPDLKALLKIAIEYDQSMFDEFTIPFSSLDYNDHEIKKYTKEIEVHD